jgi:AcrR family transcriptional regulator
MNPAPAPIGSTRTASTDHPVADASHAPVTSSIDCGTVLIATPDPNGNVAGMAAASGPPTGTTRRPRGRPAGGEHVVDRERLLDAAERVIARDGNGASLESIATEAGVTKPIVYARVGSRAELSNALAARLADRVIAAAGQGISSRSLDRASLAGLFRATFETMRAHRELFLYVTRGAGDDTAERTLYFAGTSARPLADLLARWRARQGHDEAVALPWAYAIVGMLNVVSLWWLTDQERSVNDLADDLATLVWSGMGADA